MDSEPIFLLAGLIAIFSSFIGSFTGGGSSLILLAFLLYTLPQPYLNNLALVKLSALTIVLVSGLLHLKKTKINLKFLLTLTFFGLLGTVVGTYLVQFVLNEEALRKILGVLLILVALHLVFVKVISVNPKLKQLFSLAEYSRAGFFSFIFSALNSLSGGMGFLSNAYLVSVHGLSFIEATTYLMLSSILVIGSQGIYLAFQVPINLTLLLSICLGSILGSIIGTRFQYLKGNLAIKQTTSVLMVLIGLQMLA